MLITLGTGAFVGQVALITVIVKTTHNLVHLDRWFIVCAQTLQEFLVYSQYYVETCNKWRCPPCGIVPGQHSSKEIAQQWRHFTRFDLAMYQPQVSKHFCAIGNVFNHYTPTSRSLTYIMLYCYLLHVIFWKYQKC